MANDLAAIARTSYCLAVNNALRAYESSNEGRGNKLSLILTG